MEANQIKNSAKAALDRLSGRFGENTSLVDNSKIDTDLLSGIGGMNTSAILDGETVEFLPADQYKPGSEFIAVSETESSNGQTYYNLYALVVTSRKGIETGTRFVNVGGMVRRHYDLKDAKKNEDGTYEGAVRVLTPGKFNEDLNNYGNAWNMLTNYLAGKRVTGKRGTDPHYYQKFVGGKPVPGQFIEQVGMEYSFAK